MSGATGSAPPPPPPSLYGPPMMAMAPMAMSSVSSSYSRGVPMMQKSAMRFAPPQS